MYKYGNFGVKNEIFIKITFSNDVVSLSQLHVVRT